MMTPVGGTHFAHWACLCGFVVGVLVALGDCDALGLEEPEADWVGVSKLVTAEIVLLSGLLGSVEVAEPAA
jgi:hypothetical protein